jgi:hypothetical protein
MENNGIIMTDHFFKYNFSFYAKDKNIMKVNDSSSYMLLELNKNYLCILLEFENMGLIYILSCI